MSEEKHPVEPDGIEVGPETPDEVSAENEIIAIVAEMVREIDPARLGRWLTTRNWDNINGEAWKHHDTVEKKARALALQARCDLRPPVARAKLK